MTASSHLRASYQGVNNHESLARAVRLACYNISLGLSSMNKATIRRAVQLLGAQGGKAAAERMTKAERVARAKKAAAASAKVRGKKAKERKI